MKNLTFIIALAFSVVCCGSANGGGGDEPPQPPPSQHFAGTWVTSVASDALNSKANIEATVAACAARGINNIFIVVWNGGRTLYPSAVMKSTFGVEIADRFAGRDPLREMIDAAHSAGIKVHAWFEYGFAVSNGDPTGGLIIKTKPTWAAKDASGNLLTKNGFQWANAFDPEVQKFMIDLFCEVAKNYDVDGVQGDDRMPAQPSTGGYDAITVAAYKAQHNGVAPPADYKNTAWVDWRAAILSDFFGRLSAAVRAIKPSIVISSAPSIHPWAKAEYLQDWPTWLDKGYCDMVLPQVYRYSIAEYQATLSQQITFLKTKDRGKFYPGLLIQNGSYNPTEELLREMVNENRRKGIQGESFWFYEGTKAFGSFFETYNKPKK